MKKTFMSGIVGLLGVMFGVGVVLAHAPSINITAIDGQDATSGSVAVNVSSLPTTVNIDGVVTHDDPGNVTAVKLELTDNGTVFYSNNNYFAGSGNVGTANFTIPWTISSSGNHAIVVTASHGNSDGTDTVDVTIALNVSVNQCPAAPSIAAHYLQSLGVKSGSKIYKNVVSLVAQHMGPTTMFDGVEACNADYPSIVQYFVVSNMAISK